MSTPPYPSPDSAVIGQAVLFGIVEGGPTFGKIRRPLFPVADITAATYTVGRFDFQLNVNRNGSVVISLPSARTWMRADYGGTPILIKDIGGFCSEVNFIRLTADGSELIDGQATQDLINAYGAMTLRALSDLSGWYVT